MDTHEILKQISEALHKVHGDRLESVILYGSEARGEATEDSDIDVLVLIEEPVRYGEDLEANLEALYPLSLELGRRISAKPVSSKEYRTLDCPLYRNAKEEGIAA